MKQTFNITLQEHHSNISPEYKKVLEAVKKKGKRNKKGKD